MPEQTKICRVCGAKYEACRSIRTGDKKFNWREVACSPECGEKYLRMVEESRRQEPPEKSGRGNRRKTHVIDETSVLMRVDAGGQDENIQREDAGAE